MNAESAFQAQKCATEGFKESFCGIQGSVAKYRGKRVRLDKVWWEENKYAIMLDIVYEKFHQNKALASKLLSTGDAMLIEGNTWKNKTWGVYVNKHGVTVGRNALGNILMYVRDLIRREQNEM